MAPQPLLTRGALAGTAVFAALFLSVLWRQDATVRNSLVDMSILRSPRRGDVLYTPRSILRGDLSSQTLTASEGPYLLHGSVRIPSGETVRVEPRTIVAAAEGAHLLIRGTLLVDGGTFVSTHLHPRRQFWYGVTVEDGGRADLARATIANATAALTCGRGAALTVRSVVLQDNAVGIISLPGTRQCAIERADVTGSRTAFHFIGGTPRVADATIRGAVTGIRIFHDARPTLGRVRLRRSVQLLLHYEATPDLRVQEVEVSANTHAADVITDGADVPTHRWRGIDYPTGLVLVGNTRNP